MEWQPIETAPKDGAEILVCMGFNVDGEPMSLYPQSWGIFVQVAAWWSEENRGRGEWVVYCNLPSEPRLHFKPSHWMPLPHPPEEGREANDVDVILGRVPTTDGKVSRVMEQKEVDECAHGHVLKVSGCVSCELLSRHSAQTKPADYIVVRGRDYIAADVAAQQRDTLTQAMKEIERDWPTAHGILLAQLEKVKEENERLKKGSGANDTTAA